MFRQIISDQEAEKHNAKIQNSISAISKFTTKNNIGWILEKIGGVNSQILPTEDLKKNDPSSIGGTALHVAYDLDEFMVFKILLDHGADITLPNQQGKTVVHLAVNQFCSGNYKGGKNKYVDLVLTHHVKFKIICNPCDSNGISHFHVACLLNHIEAVKFFLNNGILVDQSINMHSTISPGNTPLHLAVSLQHLEVVKILLDYNADVNLKDARGMTALHIASREALDKLCKSKPEILSARFFCASLLLNHQRNYTVNPVDEDGLSHFHIACCMNNPVVVEEFLKHCVNANQLVNSCFSTEDIGISPLHLAVKNVFGDYVLSSDQVKTIMILLKYGASLHTEDAYCNTPLHVLAELDLPNAHIFLTFIEGGADVNARNLEGQTALEILLSKRIVLFDSIVDEQYLRQFVDVNARSRERERRFLMRISHKSLVNKIVTYLIENKYNFNSFNPINEKGCLAQLLHWRDGELVKDAIWKMMQKFPNRLIDERGRTVIHNISSIEYGVQFNYEILQSDLIRGLYKFGIDVNTQDKLGRTALHLAAQFQNDVAFRYLLTIGADVNIVDVEGRTAIEYAFKTCNSCDELKNNYSMGKNFRHGSYEHMQVLFLYVSHVKRLQYCGLEVSQRNNDISSRMIAMRNLLMMGLRFWEEIDILREETKGTAACLGEFLSEIDAVLEYPYMPAAKRRAIDDYFGSGVVFTQFPETAELLNLQYWKALKRKEMIQEANDCLAVLFGIDLPYPYFRRILLSLSDREIKIFIQAVKTDESVKD